MVELAVGSTVYYFDVSRRIRDDRGRTIYREHFCPTKITGETSRSWIVSYTSWSPLKVSKKALAEKGRDRGIYASLEDVDRRCWIENHKFKMVREIERCDDYDKLRAIAKIVGYEANDGQ